MKRFKEAETAIRSAVAVLQKLSAAFPETTAHREDLASTQNNLAYLLSATGRPEEAEGIHREALAVQQKLAEEFLTIPGHRQALARSYNNLANLLKNTERPKEAETLYEKALAINQKLVAEFPNVPDFANDLANALGNLAGLKIATKEHAEAKKLLEQARPHHEAALKVNPNHPTYREHARNHGMKLCMALVGLGDHAGASAQADQLVRQPYDPASDYYNVACIAADCVRLAQDEAKLPQPARDKFAKTYADKAMAYLRQAVAHGFDDAEHLSKDTDLHPLRGRDDFKELLRELGEGKKSKEPK
jgi:tetratricopeptide (TPR) repeat protein